MQEIRPTAAFGTHLTLDGYGCDPAALADLDLIYQFLDSAPDLIGMTKIMPPYVFRYHGKVADDWGLSGFVLIAESHISIHTFPARTYLSLDVFSCKDFVHEVVVDYVVEMFRISSHEQNLLTRGLEFPRDIEAVRRHVSGEREGLVHGDI